MGNRELAPPNPVSLADQAALQVFRQPDSFERQPEDARMIRRLDAAAESLDFIDSSYWVETSRGFSVPVTFEADEEVPIISFFKLAFEGKFLCYSKLLIGRIVGGDSVRALCLTFHDATLLPHCERLPERDLLYVPVLAVDTIDSTH